MRIHIEKRLDLPRWKTFFIPLIAIIISLIIVGILLLATGQNPLVIYSTIINSAMGSKFAIAETVVKTIPLLLIGLGLSIAMRMGLVNIGAEGQFYMGAMAASWLALFHPELPPYIMLPGMILLGFVAGGLWATIATIPRAFWNVNEVITTLLLNTPAMLWVAFLISGSWKDPKGNPAFLASARFVPSAQLPTFGNTRVHLGIVIGIIVAVLFLIILNRSRWGYEIRVIGQSTAAARYSGMNVLRNIILVMFLSGGLAGLAGMAEVSGVIHRLQDQISPGYGFTAIIVSALARTHPIGLIIASFLFGILLVGGYAVQTIGVSSALAMMIQGVILFTLLGSEFFLRYKIIFISSVPGYCPDPDEAEEVV